MEPLDQICIRYGADKSTQYHGYAPLYDRLFSPFRAEPFRLLEIGIEFGKSMLTWLDYFPLATIAGVDTHPQFTCANPRYHQIVADQTDAHQMAGVATKFGPFRVVIDDGCHLASAAKVSFEALWLAVEPGGFYIVEDVGTYYHPMYQSPVEGWTWMHGFVDDVHQRGKAFHGAPAYTTEPMNQMEQTLVSVQFVKGLMILTKKWIAN